MQIDKLCKEILPCECGYRPTHYSVGYGRFPYYISCLGCGKSLHKGQGYVGNFVKLWNDKYRHIKVPGKMIDHKYPIRDD